jgi:CheY-like chemotaxis protein
MVEDAINPLWQGQGSSNSNAGTCLGQFRLRNVLGTISALVLLLWTANSVWGSDPYSTALDKRFANGPSQEQPADPGIAALERGVREQAQQMSQRVEPSRPEVVAQGTRQWLALGSVLVGGMGLGLMALITLHFVNRRLDRKAAERERALSAMVDDPLMAEFLCALHEPAVNPEAQGGSAEIQSAQPNQDQPSAAPGFFDETVVNLKDDFQKLNQARDDEERLAILREALQFADAVKQGSGSASMRSIRLLASALHGLLNQLSMKAANITPSALQTAAAAIDLLEWLCHHPCRPDLATTPPVRLLAVDDDAVSRRAVSLALKKAFSDPDLASDGRIALAQVLQEPYDVIFLDIEMPGMDGFELCSKIQQTAKNCTTPIVFVTNHSDFESRAKSELVGARDLIGKPFLAFEITVKALTLVLSRRAEHESKSGATPAEKDTNGSPKLVAA